jgi:hypothetical protein
MRGGGMTTHQSREDLVALAEEIFKLDAGERKQTDIAETLSIPQSRVSQLLKIRTNPCPHTWEAWKASEISTNVAGHLSGLMPARQRALLAERGQKSTDQWMRDVAAEAQVKKRPHTRKLRFLRGKFIRRELALPAIIGQTAIAVIEHSIGEISEEKLLERLGVLADGL